jgi:membrane-bound metal-dependent hydrolase YbcI (DUF457 family)
MSLEQVQLFVLIFPPVLYAVLALWIRPSWRIIGLSLVSGFVMGSLNMLGDMFAFYQGWWHYPFTTANHAPLTFYLATALFYGAGVMGLVGWWACKRFGWRGGVVLLVVFPLWGILRDFGGSVLYNQAQTMIVWGKGLIPVLADFLLWASAGAAGFFAMAGLEKWSAKRPKESA